MRKMILSVMVVILAVSLCACSVKSDEKDSGSTKKEETKDSGELEITVPEEEEETENEPAGDATEKTTAEGNYPGEDVVEIVNLRGDQTTVYKLADGTYLDRIERRFTYNGTDTWTDEDGVEWNEVVKSKDETEKGSSEDNYPGEDVVEIVNLRGDKTTVYKLADGTYLDRIERHFTYNGTDTWTDENGAEWNEVVK